jgi:hypothetical protein
MYDSKGGDSLKRALNQLQYILMRI